VAIRLLCVTSHGDTLNSVRPEAELFIGLARAGVEVTVMTQGNSVYAPAMREAGVRVIDFRTPAKFSPTTILTIRRTLRETGADLLQLFNNKAIVNGIFAAVGLPVKVVTYRGQTGNVSRFDPSAYLTHLSPRVDAIVCVAEAVRESLASELRNPAKAVTIHKGHELAWYDEPPVPRETLGVAADAFLVGAVANARPRKGLPVLIESAAHLPGDSQIHYVLVGAGLESRDIARALEASPCPERFTLLGFRRDATAVIAACDASVLPALKREGLPKSVIESMANGVAAVVTDTGGNAELVEHGVSGLVVPPGDPGAIADALVRLERDRRLAAALGEAARKRIGERFTVGQTVAGHLALYRRLLHGGRD
jgi:glycosyltransferase involved in cell wall biosynthesis